MKRKSFPLSRVYGLLETGPVVLVATSLEGQPNVMTMSWHTMLEFEPPLIGCVISNRNYTFNILKKTRECVIAIPTVNLAAIVVKVGNVSGKKIDKFDKFGLIKMPASLVKAPLIKQCFANLECRVVDTSMVNKYNLFVLEVLRAWIDPSVKKPRTLHHMGKGLFMVAGKTIRLPSKMK